MFWNSRSLGAAASPRSAAWKWWVCALLLCASAINYMDRQTLANAAVRITTEFRLNQEQYGNLELVFGWSFALGSILFGWLADRLPVRWVYPVVLALWSATGFATGLVHSYSGLLLCRGLLGMFEAGHWPCAMKTTQRLLAPRDRGMGNGLVQSGASVGAVLTPLAMNIMLTPEPGSWRPAFQIIGALGTLWILGWLATIRADDIAPAAPPVSAADASDTTSAGFRHVLFGRRMLVVLVIIACINTCWQTLRAWLPKFLIEGRGYAEADALYFNSLYFVVSDIGCLGAGALTLWFSRRGWPVHGARRLVFFGAAALTALTTCVVFLPKGWPLLAVLLVVGAGSLGVFPVYHALTQDISPHHQGKVTGAAGVAAWAFSPPAQKFFGRLIDKTGSFNLGLACVGWLPLIAFLCLWLFWGRTEDNRSVPGST